MAQAQVSPESFRIVRAVSKKTGERREYGCYEAWGRFYWSCDLGKTWWTTRKEARNASK